MRSLILFLVLVLLAPCVQASQVMLKLPYLATVTPGAVLLLPQNSLRSFFYVRNDGPNSAYVQFRSTVPGSSQYQGFLVVSGAAITLPSPSAPANPVYGAAPGTAALTVIEGQ